MARIAQTNLAWLGKVRKSGKGMSLELARAINVMLQKKISADGVMPKAAFKEVATSEAVRLSAGTIQFFYYELRAAFTGRNGNAQAYETLEEYWAAGRPYKQKQGKVAVGK